MEENIFFKEYFKNYLVFVSAIKKVKYFHGTTQIYSWKSNRISEENVENITKSDIDFAPTFADYHSLLYLNSNGHHLIKK